MSKECLNVCTGDVCIRHFLCTVLPPAASRVVTRTCITSPGNQVCDACLYPLLDVSSYKPPTRGLNFVSWPARHKMSSSTDSSTTPRGTSTTKSQLVSLVQDLPKTSEYALRRLYTDS